MKKAIALIISAVILATLFVPEMRVLAAPSVVLTAVNDRLLSDISPSNMPQRINSQMYVSYSVLGKLENIKYYYSSELRQLSVYNFDYRLIFDLSTNEVWDEKYVYYTYNAEWSNGDIFVPIRMICEKFGFIYSYIPSNSPAPIIRINKTAPSVSNADFASKNQATAQHIFNTYQKAYVNPVVPKPDNPGTPISPGTPTTPSTPEVLPVVPPKEKKIGYLTFNGEINENTALILDKLTMYGMKATFFVAASSAPSHADILRRIYAEGHSIGLYITVPPETSPDALAEMLRGDSEVICAILKTKAHLLHIDGGSESLTPEQRETAINEGYRLWDTNMSVRSESGKAATIWANAKKFLNATSKTAILNLYSNAETAIALPKILSYISSNEYSVLQIYEWVSPINDIRELR